MDKLLFYDLETTGVMHWKNGIHQLSCMVTIGGENIETHNFKVAPNPKAIIEKEALDIANVTEEQIKAYPPMNEVYRDFTKMLCKYVNKFDKKDKFHLVGFNNAPFDNQFLRAFFVQNNDQYFGSMFWSDTIDVMCLASNHLRAVRNQMKDFKLKTVAAFLGIEVDEEKLHDAVYDLHLTQSIYHLVNKA